MPAKSRQRQPRVFLHAAQPPPLMTVCDSMRGRASASAFSNAAKRSCERKPV